MITLPIMSLRTYVLFQISFIQFNDLKMVLKPKIEANMESYLSCYINFKYSEKSTKIWPIFHFDIVFDINKWKIGQIFVAFSEIHTYLNFILPTV